MQRFLPPMHVLRWAFAALAVVVAALLGSQWGAYRERSQVADKLNEYQSSLASIEEKHLGELTQLRTQRDVVEASNKELQAALKEIQAESLDKQSAQSLYENIENGDTSRGLAVDTVIKVNDENGTPSELHITVVQARGRERVKGQIGVSLLGEKDGTNWREIIAEAGSDSAPRFDMRFFQTLVVPLPEHNILVDIVEIDVKPDGKRHKAISFEADWAAIPED